MIGPLVRPDEVAHMLNVSPRCLYRLVDRGKVPAYRVGRQLRFELAEVLAALRTRSEEH